MLEQKQGETNDNGLGIESDVESSNTSVLDSVTGSISGQTGFLNDILVIEAEFERAIVYDANNRARNKENWQVYSGLNEEQFKEEDRAAARAENRRLDTFNLARQKVDSLVGAVLKNPFEPEYIPVEGKITEGTQAIKQAWNVDKDLCGWENLNKEAYIDAFVYLNVTEMYISRKWNEDLGNVSLRRLNPAMFVFDPNWKSNDPKDCTKGWKVSYLTPRQIKGLYPDLGGRIEREIIANRFNGDFYTDGNATSVTPDIDLADYSTDRFRVISRYEVVDEEYWCECDAMTNIELPETDDIAVKIAHLNRTNDKWDPEQIIKRPRKRKVCYVTTICPQISRQFVLEHKKTEVQIGRLPFFPLSAARINGQFCGIVDLIKDVQRVLNYRENLLSFMLETQANGAQIGDPMLFGGDKKKMDDFVSRKNQPNAFFWSASGSIMKGADGIRNVKTPESNSEFVNQLMRMWDIADRISKSPAVSDGRTEGQGESGYLYAQKSRVAEQQQYVLLAQIKQWLADIAESYFVQSKIQYSIGMFEREFTINDGEGTITFNKKVVLPNGQVGIVNDISAIPRHRVAISESPAGLTNRLTARALDTELLKVIRPENIGSIQIITSELLSTLDHSTRETKKKLMAVRELEEKQAILTLEGNVMKLEMNNIKAKEELERLKKESLAKRLKDMGVDPALILQETGIDVNPPPPMPDPPPQATMPSGTMPPPPQGLPLPAQDGSQVPVPIEQQGAMQ